MDLLEQQLRSYYEEEARQRLRPSKGDRRRLACERFAQRLSDERRSSVLDVGAGPASDHGPFVLHGIRYVGIDLAVGNASIGAELGQTIVPASLFNLPFADGSFAAGWSMSTFQHVPDDQIDGALVEFARVLQPGSLVTIGMWGGRDEVIDSTSSRTGVQLPRRFVLRNHQRIRALLREHLDVEFEETFQSGPSDWEYHLALGRTSMRSVTG